MSAAEQLLKLIAINDEYVVQIRKLLKDLPPSQGAAAIPIALDLLEALENSRHMYREVVSQMAELEAEVEKLRVRH